MRMIHRRKLAIGLAAVLGIGAGGLSIAQAVGGESASTPNAIDDDADRQVGGSEGERAGLAALDAVGGGRVLGVEREDERAVMWEVEVVQGDGRELEVELDENLERAAVDRDDAGAEPERADDDGTGGDDD